MLKKLQKYNQDVTSIYKDAAKQSRKKVIVPKEEKFVEQPSLKTKQEILVITAVTASIMFFCLIRFMLLLVLTILFQ